MKLRYTCDCGHENLWPVFERKISNFICEGCSEFIGAYGNDLKFAGEKGVGIYKKYDSIAEELVLMRCTENHQHCGFVPQITLTSDYMLFNTETVYNIIHQYLDTANYIYNISANYNNSTSITFQWSEV